MSKSFYLRDLPWVIARITRKMLYSTPSVSWHIKISRIRGFLLSRLHGSPVHVRKNIESVFGEELDASKITRIVRRHEEMSGQLYLSWILPEHPRSKNPDLWRLVGRQHLEGALARGQGVILVTAHLGFVRMMAFMLRVHGYPVIQIAAGGPERETIQQERSERLLRASKLKRLVHERTRVISDLVQPFHVPAGLDVRPIVEALEANQIVLIPGDGMRAAEFIELPLLGREYPFATGYMKMAMLTGASVVPAFAVEDEDRKRIVVEIQPLLGVDPHASVEENLRLYVETLESQLRRAPHLWHRWRIGEDCFVQTREWARMSLGDRYESGSGTRIASRFE